MNTKAESSNKINLQHVAVMGKDCE